MPDKKNEIIGIIIAIISILTIISLISFEPNDIINTTSTPKIPVKNLIGIAGAYTAHGLNFIFGKISYLFILFILISGWYIFKSKKFKEVALSQTGIIILIISSSIFFCLIAQDKKEACLLGGILGYILSEFSKNYIGTTGTYITALSLMLISLILATKLSIYRIYSILSAKADEIKKSAERPPFITKIKIEPMDEADGIDEEEPEEEPQTDDRSKNLRPIPAQKNRPSNTGEHKEITPPRNLLNLTPRDDTNFEQYINQTKDKLKNILKEFEIEADVTNYEKGPVITRYELQLAPGIKVNKIVGLSDNIAMSLAAQRVRIVAPIPGKSAVGVEIPNKTRSVVTLGDVLCSKTYKPKSQLDVALGKDISGEAVLINLADSPHILIAGSTGSGKSVCLNSLICNLIYNSSYEDVKFLMIDPKMVELKVYNGIPHLLTEVITNVKKVVVALKRLVDLMEDRYELMDQKGARDIAKYNSLIEKTKEDFEKMPYIIVIIDELADIMMIAQRDIEDSIIRLAQKARAVGIHLILATQRPSVDVITGVIKANFPTRIAFQVASKVDSRTILDSNGAEKLLGKGDMLLSFAGSTNLVRIQGCYISEEEVEQIVKYMKDRIQPQYDENMLEETEEETGIYSSGNGKDELYEEAKHIVQKENRPTASYLQRRLQIGYNRAARLIEMMEDDGVVSPPRGNKQTREVLIKE